MYCELFLRKSPYTTVFIVKVKLLGKSEFPLCALKVSLAAVQEMKWVGLPSQLGCAFLDLFIHMNLLTAEPSLYCLASHFLDLKARLWLKNRDVDKISAAYLSYPQPLSRLGLWLEGPTLWVFCL